MTPPFTTADDAWTVRAWRDDLHVALSLLTRLPVGAPPAAACLSERPKRAFPLVAAFMGLAAGGASQRFFCSVGMWTTMATQHPPR
jgi:cobalamin synthase